MTPPEAPANGHEAGSADTPPAVSVRLETLKNRPDFLACARARKAPMPGFLLQGRDRRDDGDVTRVGFTASKKIGNAVTRNRAKRRMRALAREVIATHGRAGWDYVLVARPGATVSRDFASMRDGLAQGLGRLHAPKSRRD
jgi:ribonuclease P protein component